MMTEGAGRARLVVESAFTKLPVDWSSDNDVLSYIEMYPNPDLWQLPMDVDRLASRLRQTPFQEWGGQSSPDGRWIAYASDESGEFQVYAERRSASGGERERISTSGGLYPRWRGDGRELYYVTPDDELMAVNVTARGNALEVGVPLRLFQATLLRLVETLVHPFDVTADGQRFLINERVDDSLTPMTWVLDWTAELPELQH